MSRDTTTTEPGNLAILEHKLDLLLRLSGLTPDQIEQIVEAKDASKAQQALIDKFVADNAAKNQPKTTVS